jgi:hypothetical protein
MWWLASYINARPYVMESVAHPAALRKPRMHSVAVNNLLITLATGLLAGLGLLLTSRPKESYAGRWIQALDLDKIQWPRRLQFYTLLPGVSFFTDL